MWQAIVRIVALAWFAVAALGMVGIQTVAAQSTGESGGFSGVLWEDLDEDGERGSEEEALAGMIIVLYSIDPPGDDEVDRAVTELDGAYAFTSLPDGRYDVRVEISSGSSAGTVSGAGVEGRWLSELRTEDWDLGLIRHDPSLPPRRDPVPPPQVSVDAITVERPAASAPTSESVPTDGDQLTSSADLEVLGKVEVTAPGDGIADQAQATSVAPPPRVDPPAPTTEVPEPEVASATTFIASGETFLSSTAPPATAARAETTAPTSGTPRSQTIPDASPSTLAPPPTAASSSVRPGGEVALGTVESAGGAAELLDDRAMTLVTSMALTMTGMALLTGTRRRRRDLRP